MSIEIIARYLCDSCKHRYNVSYVSDNPTPRGRRICEKCKDLNYTAYQVKIVSKKKYNPGKAKK